MDKKIYDNDINSCTLYKLVRTSDNSHVDEFNSILYCNDEDAFDECVFMTSHMFQEIWKKTWSSMTMEERLLPIVKLSYNGNSIYRRYRQCSATGFQKFQVGLNQRSISLLCPGDDILGLDRIRVEVGDEESFFKYHPNHSTRISYSLGEESNKLGSAANVLSEEANKIGKRSVLLGIASLVLGVGSIVLAIVSLIQSCN